MVTTYTALHLVEVEKSGLSDSKMVILFDESEQNYYLYGTRRQLKSVNNERLHYEYVYDYSRLNSLVSLILLITNKLSKENNDCDYTIEIHNIQIDTEEYPYLDYFYLINKFSKHNEMVAYDNHTLKYNKLKKILKTLTSSY